MLTTPMDLLSMFPMRKTKEQKRRFRDAVQGYAEMLDYVCRKEANYLLIGEPENANYLLAADDACDAAILSLLEILRSLPDNRRDRVCFLVMANSFFATRSYQRAHPETAHQLIIRLENVGSGDRIRMFPSKKLNEDRRKLTSFYKACGYFGKKSLLVQEKHQLPGYYPFPYAMHICTLEQGKKECYCNRNQKSSVPDTTNINILRAALVSYLCCDAAQ